MQGGVGGNLTDVAGIADASIQGLENEMRSLLTNQSYTRAMRSRSDYVRSDRVAEVRKEIAEHQRLKKLTNEWIDLSIEASKLRMMINKKKEKG